MSMIKQAPNELPQILAELQSINKIMTALFVIASAPPVAPAPAVNPATTP
jgi:hypothetical protein